MDRVLEARKAWMPNSSAPSFFSRLKAWVSCSRVMPYLASPGVVHELEALLRLPQSEGPAWVVSAGDPLGNGSDGVLLESRCG